MPEWLRMVGASPVEAVVEDRHRIRIRRVGGRRWRKVALDAPLGAVLRGRVRYYCGPGVPEPQPVGVVRYYVWVERRTLERVVLAVLAGEATTSGRGCMASPPGLPELLARMRSLPRGSLTLSRVRGWCREEGLELQEVLARTPPILLPQADRVPLLVEEEFYRWRRAKAEVLERGRFVGEVCGMAWWAVEELARAGRRAGRCRLCGEVFVKEHGHEAHCPSHRIREHHAADPTC